MKIRLLGAAILLAATGLSTAAMAGPTYTFTSSVGTQPSNVGTVKLEQVSSTTVKVTADLLNTNYGFLNTGGPHTPFAFNLNISDANLSIDFLTPDDFNLGGVDGCASTFFFFCTSNFSLNKSGGDNTPYGTFTTAIDWSEGNGSNNAWYGDLIFTLTNATGLSTDNFVSNGSAYFSADLTNHDDTGAQAWNTRTGGTTVTTVPEPLTLSLFGAGLAAAAGMRRRRKSV